MKPTTPRFPAKTVCPRRVLLPLSGTIEVTIDDSESSKDAKAQALSVARTFIDGLATGTIDDSLIDEWRINVPNRSNRDGGGIVIEEVPRLCGGPLEVVTGRKALRCGKCGKEAHPRHRGAQCNRPIKAAATR